MAINGASMTRAAWGGVGLAVLFAVVNGISTYLLTDDAGAPISLQTWVDDRVAGA